LSQIARRKEGRRYQSKREIDIDRFLVSLLSAKESSDYFVFVTRSGVKRNARNKTWQIPSRRRTGVAVDGVIFVAGVVAARGISERTDVAMGVARAFFNGFGTGVKLLNTDTGYSLLAP